jgi:NAD(P)-dependent dehydrogenase (short-subunit alcohol dehydrogenase family)
MASRHGGAEGQRAERVPDLTGRVAFITGGAVGIGREFARALVDAGAAVAIADIDADAGERTAAALRADGGTAIAVACDVGDEARVDSAVDEAVRELGGIDILVNNAALHFARWSRPVTELPGDMWRQLLETNVIGIVNCARCCRPQMRARGGGVVLNMSSVAGFMPLPDFGFTSSYAVTKLAVRGLTVALAAELADDGIRVVGLAPGGTSSEAAGTDLQPGHLERLVEHQLIRRQGTMSDLVGPMLFLCSDAAAMVTGETMVVGGGFPLRL